MLSNPPKASLLLATSVAIVTSVFLIIFGTVPRLAIIINFIISFGTVYLFTYLAIEFFIFREIKKINHDLEKLKKNDLSFLPKIARHSNPLQKINDDIYSYARLKQKEIEDLKKLTTYRREFLFDVSHELKTPIFAAQGFVHTLLDGAVQDKSVRRKFLKKAAKSLDALELMVEDLMTIAHMETGEIKMNFKNFNIVEMAREVVDQLDDKALKKNIEIVVSAEPPETIIVYGDPRRIFQVITNLVSNAIKYSKSLNGLVELEIKENDPEVFISVKDNGIGIPQEDITRIFERFYRVDKSRSKEKGGAGLGLAIVKHILEAHDSRITVNSALGEGSTFIFRLKKAGVDKKIKITG